MEKKTVVLIPAYDPTKELIEYSEKLIANGYPVVVVDDGSEDSYDGIFTSLPDEVRQIRYKPNRGKGSALKTGITYIMENMPDVFGIVTADADGQHKPEDIEKVALALEENEECLVLGSRKFDNGAPFKSILGNTITRFVFRLVSGSKVYDTQTGLRGFSRKLFEFMLGQEGDRYEYEMNVLMYAARSGIRILEVPIQTVYIDDNSASHFDIVKDSIRIYSRILKFGGSSLASAAIDFILLLLLKKITAGMFSEDISLLASVIGARIVSSLFNYTMNKKVVFASANKGSFIKYYLLVLVNMGLNYCLLWLLNIKLGINLAVAKLIVETVLFILSYSVQKNYIFTKTDKSDDKK